MIGKIVTGSYEGGSHTFLNHPVISWTRAHGDPRTVILNPEAIIRHAASSSSSSIETTIRPKKFDGKLSGQYIWPYSFPFPSEIILQGDDRGYPAPQTFLERGEKTTVQYNLVLKMTHGVLRADTKFVSNHLFCYDLWNLNYLCLDYKQELCMCLRSLHHLLLYCVSWRIVKQLGFQVLQQTLSDGTNLVQQSSLASFPMVGPQNCTARYVSTILSNTLRC